MDKRYSIVHSFDRCIVCGCTNNLNTHEILFGTANRKQSIKYGLCCKLCYKHHNGSNEGVHFNKALDLKLKKLAQKKFEEHYPDLDFVKIFGRNYD